jgi:hypothetical protein
MAATPTVKITFNCPLYVYELLKAQAEQHGGQTAAILVAIKQAAK